MIKRKGDGLEECEMSDTVWAQIFQNWIHKCNKMHLESNFLLLLLCITFLISNFCRVLYVVGFLLGNSMASEFYMPTFRNTLSFPSS
jgi:hypothetical protein